MPGPAAADDQASAATEEEPRDAAELDGAPAAPRQRTLESLVGALFRRVRDTRTGEREDVEGDPSEAAPQLHPRSRTRRPKRNAPRDRGRLHAVDVPPESPEVPDVPDPGRKLLGDLERLLAAGRISRPDFERWSPIAAGLAEVRKAVADSARAQTAGATTAAAAALKALRRLGGARRGWALLLGAAASGGRTLRRTVESAPRPSLPLRAVARRATRLAAETSRAEAYLTVQARRVAGTLAAFVVVVARPLRRLWPVLAALLVAAGIAAAALTQVGSTTSALYTLFVSAALLLGAIGWTTLAWMLDAWRNPQALAATRLHADQLEPALAFSLIVPARHEEAVLATTLSRLVTTDHPDFEVVVVVGDDDPETAAVAERVAARNPELVKVVVDTNPVKNKPRALNTGLPHCSGEVVGVFDAEDDVHPGLLKRVDQRFQRTAADVVQAGVQLMNFHSSWFAVRNVLEYYFWFRSRLHVHARQGFIPLGGNTVFVRTEVLRAVGGWDADCLTEDCELGVRLSSLGARTVVVYEPELVTREECPPTLGSFTRQRTRWNQGFLQTLAKGYWHRLPLSQQALGIYILAMPYLMAVAWLMMPAALVTAIIVTASVPITLISILPALPMLAILAVELVGLHEFCEMYGERATTRDYVRLIVGLPFYQVVISFAALRAVVREAFGLREWEKTMHFGFHLALQPSGPGKRITEWPRIPSRRARLAQGRPERQPLLGTAPGGRPAPRSESLAPRIPLISVYADALTPERPAEGDGVEEARRRYRFARTAALAGAGSAGASLPVDGLVGYGQGHPLLARLHAAAAGGVAGRAPVLPLSGLRAGAGSRSIAAWLGRRLGRVAAARIDLAIVVPLLVVTGIVQATNMLHWPGTFFDEGTYMSNAWAVGTHGVLSNYTYGYGHPPLGWLMITLWVAATGAGRAAFSIDAGREFMLLVGIVSCWLVYVLARRMQLRRPFAVLAVLLFALSPLSVFFHRLVLLDNLATTWALAAFVLALTPTNRLWAYAGSGACFAASVLCKETILVILPALLLAVVQFSHKGTRRYCLALFSAFFLLFGGLYPLYAALKGEFLPGRGHVSLLGEVVTQLFTRQSTGSVFDRTSLSYGTVHFWLNLDPWLVIVGLALAPVSLLLPRLRWVGIAYLIQVAMIVRPGYLPAMYVIALLPFAALLVAGVADALWRFVSDRGRALEGAGERGDWRGSASRATLLLRPALVAAAALVLVSSAAAAASLVVPSWVKADRQAANVRLDGPERSAEQWLVQHVTYNQHVLVTDEIWLYLVQHDFDAHPMKGGFFSRTVVFYWPLDYDPAVERAFPQGWRDFQYVVSTPDVRNTAYLTPNTAAALRHSHTVAKFGEGGQLIQIRRIDTGQAATTPAANDRFGRPARGRPSTARAPRAELGWPPRLPFPVGPAR